MGNERIDAVVVDEESVGSADAPGFGGKILKGENALERYLEENKKSMDSEVIRAQISQAFVWIVQIGF